MMHMKKMRKKYLLILYLSGLVFLCGCSPDSKPVISEMTAPTQDSTFIPSTEPSSESVNEALLPTEEINIGSRDNSPQCLVPEAGGIDEVSNEYASIDYSYASEGYIMVRYTGPSPKVKLRITGTDSVTYTYNLIGDEYEAFPLSSGDGSYDITVFENLSGTSYIICLTANINAALTNEFGPYLYPNQYCKFDSTNETVKKAVELAQSANSDLEVVTNVYNYIIETITYDYEKAETVPSGYTADVDQILENKTGICLDYAAVMTSMLRSQRIPTRLEVGYVGDAYHAWISTYITDMGWVNGIVQFDGENWKLLDPTFAANSNETELKNFIGDGSNYIVKYIY